jgi:hypothetical protein
VTSRFFMVRPRAFQGSPFVLDHHSPHPAFLTRSLAILAGAHSQFLDRRDLLRGFEVLRVRVHSPMRDTRPDLPAYASHPDLHSIVLAGQDVQVVRMSFLTTFQDLKAGPSSPVPDTHAPLPTAARRPCTQSCPPGQKRVPLHNVEIPLTEKWKTYHHRVSTGTERSPDATFQGSPTDTLRVANWQALG